LRWNRRNLEAHPFFVSPTAVFKNLKIGTRLAICFGIVVLLMLAIAAIALGRLSTTAATIAQATEIRQNELAPLYNMRESLAQTGISARNAFIIGDDAQARAELDLVDQQRAHYMQRLDALDALLGKRADYAKVRDGLHQMAKELDRPRKYREAHDMTGYAAFLVDECTPLRRRIVADLNAVIAAIESDLNQAGRSVDTFTSQSTWIVLAISVVALAIAALLATLVTLSVVRPIKQACGFAEAVERGDLTVPLESQSRDELGSMMRTLDQMRLGLEKIVREVRDGSAAISHVTAEIAAGNSDLSHRTESQASSLQQTAASMETLTHTVRTNADGARAAGTAAVAASMVASEGGQVMRDVIEKMNTIDAAAARIADIVGVIDGIAFQTNILALNAAVEAARAGEQGRGFAVVAGEVRTLAQRSATAAKEIKGLIGESTSAIASGSELVARAGKTMGDIVDNVSRLAASMQEMGSASENQAVHVREINQAVSHVDGLTQQNAALVEQASAAAHSLHEQSQRLSDQVGRFRTSDKAVRALALA
jgi:methyl-accepting chemotaxis protein